MNSAIELRHTDPLIWRQVEVADLDHADDIIQPVMGWFDDHLWESTIDKQRYDLSVIAAGSAALALSFLLTRSFLPLALSFLLNSISPFKMVLEAPMYKLE